MRENKDKISIKKRLVIIMGTVFFLVVAINFYQGFAILQEKNAEIEKLEAEIEQVKDERKDLETELEYLESKDYVERMAREQLGLVKEGEKLYINIGDY